MSDRPLCPLALAMRVLVALFSLSLAVSPLSAQQARTGVVVVTVEESMGMFGGLVVRSAGRTARTDSTGLARLTLPEGRQVISVTGIGIKPAQTSVVVVADSVVSVKLTVEMGSMDNMVMEPVKVSATRIERLAGETPDRVEVLDQMEVQQNTLMAPSGISMLLSSTPGMRVQTASPTLGTGSVRILGLPGQYTAMLADGLPLYGGGASALGPLDISPVDLQRAEIIKGAASALYGGQALGGVVNLVSKAPSGNSEVLLNRRTMGVTDAATWMSRKIGESAGVSLLASGTDQHSVDVDGDGWTDQPDARRWSLRPRFTATDANGRSVFVTAGYGYDTRNGGTVAGGHVPNGSTFREGLTSNRADVGSRAIIPLADSGNLAVRFALANTQRSREFGLNPLEDDRSTTGFVEVTRTNHIAKTTAVLGSSLQYDGFEDSAKGAFDHRWLTPSLFATSDRAFGPITFSASIRGDAHPAAGLQATERLAALVKPVDNWSIRMSVGTGFAPPTPITEETEAIGLRAMRPDGDLRPEKSHGAMVDINGSLVGAEVLLTGYGSVISNAIQLADAGDSSSGGVLRNAASDTRIGGLEGAALWRFDGGRFLATYGYARGSRPDATSGLREPMPLIPRHRVGGDLMFERPGKYSGGIEGIWYGRQALDDDPFRIHSKPYLYLMAIYVREFGPLEAVANFENLLNIRQTQTDPLVRPGPTIGGRWTTDVWAPLEGFMANVALRYRW